MKPLLPAALLALASVSRPSAALAAPACNVTVDQYAATYLHGGKIGWLARDDRGAARATVDAAEAIRAGAGPGSGLGASAASAAADDVALYADELQLPSPLDLGVAWHESSFSDQRKLQLLIADASRCLVGSIDLDGYSASGATGPADASRIDADAVEGKYPIEIFHEGCGEPVASYSSLPVQIPSPKIEAAFAKSDESIAGLGRGMGGLPLAGRSIQIEFFQFYPFERAPRLVLQGDGAQFELPLYMGSGAPRLPPARVIVQCRDDGDVDVLYVRGAVTRRFSRLPIQIR